METEKKLKEALLPVFGLNSIEEIKSNDTLLNDLGADSLDFVEIVFIIEREFGVKLETRELVSGGKKYSEEIIFKDGALSEEGVKIMRMNFPLNPERFQFKMTKMEIFQSITIQDIATIIEQKLREGK
jgi:acyl carrier protein